MTVTLRRFKLLRATVRVIANPREIDNIVLKNVKKNDQIIFGARAINAQISPLFRRPTKDFDIIAKRPRKSAMQLERKLDRRFGGDFFLTKPAQFPGTWKVKSKFKGPTIADFSGPKKGTKIVVIKGIKYRSLSQQTQDKLQSVRNPEFAFRRDKDLDDLNRIRSSNNLRKTFRRFGFNGAI